MDKKTILDTIHQTILCFIDPVDDNCENEVISEKDKLLLEVNKALTTNIKKLYEQETV
jgi:hypothetical protein